MPELRPLRDLAAPARGAGREAPKGRRRQALIRPAGAILAALLALLPAAAPPASAAPPRSPGPPQRIPEAVRREFSLPLVLSPEKPPEGRRLDVGVRMREGRISFHVNGEWRRADEAAELFLIYSTAYPGPDSVSRLPVVLYADRSLSFGLVWRARWALASRDLGRIHWAVATPDGQVGVLPPGRPFEQAPPEERVRFDPLEILQFAGAIRIMAGGQWFEGDVDGRAKLAKWIESGAATAEGRIPCIMASEPVPFQEIVSLCAALRRGGATDVTLLPPPPEEGWSLSPEVAAEIEVPKAAGMERGAAYGLAVGVLGDGHYIVEESECSLRTLGLILDQKLRDPVMSRFPPLTIVAGGERTWEEIRPIFEACAERSLLRTEFMVRNDEKTLAIPAWLPHDDGAGALWLQFTLRPGEGGATIRLKDKDLGAGDAGFARLAEVLAAIRAPRKDADVRASITLDPKTRYEDLIRLLDALRTQSIHKFVFAAD